MRYPSYNGSGQEEAAAGRTVLHVARKCLLVLTVVMMVLVFCSGMSASGQQKQYFEAVTAMDNGEYLEAIEVFESLNGYKDSEEMITECWYLHADQLFDEGKFRSATVIYKELAGYKNADICLQKCFDAAAYYEAVDLYEKEAYVSAYAALGNMSEHYKDSLQLAAKCLLGITRQYYDIKDYQNAYSWYIILKEFQDVLPKEMDISFTEKLRIRHAESLISTGESKDIAFALEILNSMESTNEIKKLIAKGEKQLNQNKYDAAAEQLKNREYVKAADGFAKIKDFSDAKQQWLTAMYAYVQDNKDKYEDQSGNESSISYVTDGIKRFYNYAETLAENDFKDSKEYYEKLTAWKVDIVMNGNKNSLIPAASIKRSDNMCAHLTLRGGPLDGETTIRYEFTFPNGKKTSGEFDYPWKSWYTGTCLCYYGNPEKEDAGTCSVRIFDGEGNVIGQSSIKVE